MKLSQIAAAIGAKIENADPATEITGVSGIDQAVPGQLTFVHNPKYDDAAKARPIRVRSRCSSPEIFTRSYLIVPQG